MRQIAEFIAVFACALFTGAAIYVNLVEHPARMQCGVEIAATEFPPSHRRGAIMQATLAALGLLSSVAAWLSGASFWWIVAGVLLGSVIPFTLIAILPTNKRLLSLHLINTHSKRNACSHDGVGFTRCGASSAASRCFFSRTWQSSSTLRRIVLTESCLLRRGCSDSSQSPALPCRADLRT